MRNFLLILTISVCALPACRSKIKQQEDSIYSRHLQRHVALTVITTPMPNNKEEMNLLLFIGSKNDLLEHVRAKKVMDSLWKKDLIQPLTLVCFEGQEKDYGLEESNDNVMEAIQHLKFNHFIMTELYPFIKEKVVIRKFNSIAIYGSGYAAISAFEIAWHHDDKIQKAGMFYPAFSLQGDATGDSLTLETIRSSRMRPNLNIWIAGDSSSVTESFINSISGKQNVSVQLVTRERSFSNFLLWAFPK